MFSPKFNKVATCLLAAATMLTAGCIAQQTPEQQAANQKQETANVVVNKSTCSVLDRSAIKHGFEGLNNKYDFKNGVLRFNSGYTFETAVAIKDLAEDGQARATEMFTFLAGTTCKAPKFN